MAKTTAQFPWETLKAETLRSMCKDFEIPATVGRKREDYIKAFQEIEIIGLSAFLQQLAETEEQEKEEPTPKAKPVKKTPAPTRKTGRSNAKTPARSTRKSRSTFDGVVLRSTGSAASRRRSGRSTA